MRYKVVKYALLWSIGITLSNCATFWLDKMDNWLANAVTATVLAGALAIHVTSSKK